MKILNMFAGIGGNRTLWGNDHYIEAVEYDEDIGKIYKMRFPDDAWIQQDAYEYFLENFQKFDFIWASPPCTSHTRLVNTIVGNRYAGRKFRVKLPDLRLYSLILFLKHQFRGTWIVENVRSYYKPLIKPTSKIGRHYIWSNMNIPKRAFRTSMGNLTRENYKIIINEVLIKKKIQPKIFEELLKLDHMKTKQIINNVMLPEEGKYIFDCMKTKTLEDF